MKKDMLTNEIIEDLIATVEIELASKHTSSIIYWCEDGTEILTDVGYVYNWFNEYKEVIRRKYR